MTLFYLDKDAIYVQDLITQPKCELKQIADNIKNIYAFKIDETEYILKVYNMHARGILEKDALDMLKIHNIQGVPQILEFIDGTYLTCSIMRKLEGIDLLTEGQKRLESKRYTLGFIFPESEMKMIVRKVLKILRDIHAIGLVNRDVKAENIMYSKETQNIYLIDFEGMVMTYQSPETLRRNSADSKHDIWCLGLTIYRCMTGRKIPYNKVCEPDFPTKWCDSFKDFMNCLLEKDKNQRYSAEQALNHPWIFDEDENSSDSRESG